MNIRKHLIKILEDNTAGAGGAFGDAGSMGHGGNVGNDDFYARGDSRVPKVLGVTVSRAGAVGGKRKKKKRKKQKLSIYEAEQSIDDVLNTYKAFKKPKKEVSEYDPIELHKGTKVEMEHTTKKDVARIIAMAHLDEDPQYYVKLAKMEGND